MLSEHLQRIATWCEQTRLPLRLRTDAVWLPNPAAPRYGVLIRDADGVTEWSMPFPIPALPDRVADTRRALFLLNERSDRGMWELLPDRTVRYVLHVAHDVVGDSAALMASLRVVLDAGNTHVHALVEVMAGREPAEYVLVALEGLDYAGDASSGPPATGHTPVELRVLRIIDRELWSQANPSAVMFLAPGDGPLGLGVVFGNSAAGVEIFGRWRTEIGPEDTYELIRVTITEDAHGWHSLGTLLQRSDRGHGRRRDPPVPRHSDRRGTATVTIQPPPPTRPVESARHNEVHDW